MPGPTAERENESQNGLEKGRIRVRQLLSPGTWPRRRISPFQWAYLGPVLGLGRSSTWTDRAFHSFWAVGSPAAAHQWHSVLGRDNARGDGGDAAAGLGWSGDELHDNTSC